MLPAFGPRKKEFKVVAWLLASTARRKLIDWILVSRANGSWSRSLFSYSSLVREILQYLEILGAVEGPRSNGQKGGGTYYEEPTTWTRTYYYVGQEPLMKIMVGIF